MISGKDVIYIKRSLSTNNNKFYTYDLITNPPFTKSFDWVSIDCKETRKQYKKKLI